MHKSMWRFLITAIPHGTWVQCTEWCTQRSFGSSHTKTEQQDEWPRSCKVLLRVTQKPLVSFGFFLFLFRCVFVECTSNQSNAIKKKHTGIHVVWYSKCFLVQILQTSHAQCAYTATHDIFWFSKFEDNFSSTLPSFGLFYCKSHTQPQLWFQKSLMPNRMRAIVQYVWFTILFFHRGYLWLYSDLTAMTSF